MIPKYEVEIEYLDEEGNVWDSHCVFATDFYEEAVKKAEEVELSGPDEQVAVWEWDDNRSAVEDSWIIKTFEE